MVIENNVLWFKEAPTIKVHITPELLEIYNRKPTSFLIISAFDKEIMENNIVTYRVEKLHYREITSGFIAMSETQISGFCKTRNGAFNGVRTRLVNKCLK